MSLGSPVGRSIWWRHTYEAEIDALLRSLLKTGDVFIDVGANVGYFSMIAARLVGPTGEVHGFEPDLRLHAMLARSVAQSGLSNVWCHRMALWSQKARLNLVGTGDRAFQYLAAESAGDLLTPTLAVALDQYLEAVAIGRPIRLVKIDVEGGEVAVIQGMAQVLATDHPVLVVEAHDPALARFGNRIEDIFHALAPHGYFASDGNGGPIADAVEARKALKGHLAPNLIFRSS